MHVWNEFVHENETDTETIHKIFITTFSSSRKQNIFLTQVCFQRWVCTPGEQGDPQYAAWIEGKQVLGFLKRKLSIKKDYFQPSSWKTHGKMVKTCESIQWRRNVGTVSLFRLNLLLMYVCVMGTTALHLHPTLPLGNMVLEIEGVSIEAGFLCTLSFQLINRRTDELNYKKCWWTGGRWKQRWIYFPLPVFFFFSYAE